MKRTSEQDWDVFWGFERSKKFARISWSKRRILQILHPYLASGKWALDAGCGSGFFSRVFTDCGMNTVSLDYSPKALEMAASATQGRSKILQANLLEKDISSVIGQRFDLIFTDGLFEHFTPPEQDIIMNNFTSILSQNGVIITFVPNRWSPWELIRPFFMPGIKEKPFVLSELSNMSQRNRLLVTEAGGINVFPFRLSPEKWAGKYFGMLLFSIAKMENI